MEESLSFQIFDSLADGVLIIGEDHIIHFNNETEKKSHGDGTGKICYEHLHGLDEPCSFCNINRVLAGETVRWERTDENGRVFDLIDTPFALADGVNCKIEISRDITSSAQTKKPDKAELKTECDALAKLVELSPDGYVLLSKNGVIRFWSRGAEKIFGCTKKEAVGHHMSFLASSKEIGEKHQRKLEEVIKKGVATYEEHRITEDNREMDLEVTATAFEYDRGPINVFVVIRDVTERNKLLHKLIQEGKKRALLATDQELLLKLIELAPDGFAMVDETGTIKFWNEGAENIFGYTTNEAIGSHMSLITGGEASKKNGEAGIKKAMEKSPAAFSGLQMTKEGKPVEIESASTTIRTGTGETRMLSVFRDVTRMLDLIKQLERKESQLRSIARENVSAQEAERQRISQELHEGVGQSLSALKINLLGMQNDICPENQGTLERAIDIVSSSLQQLREISLDLRPPMLDELGLVSTIYWMIDRFQQSSGIAAKFFPHSFTEEIPKNVDLAFFRIVQEALSNIAKHSKASRVDITLKEAGHLAHLEIHDNGKGFDPDAVFACEDLEKGIGLVSVRERAERLGGDITVESNPKSGTTIKARVPLKEEQKTNRK